MFPSRSAKRDLSINAPLTCPQYYMFPKLYLFFALPLLVLLTFSCQHKQQGVSQHQIDSVVEANRDLLYAAPLKADSTFMQWQKRTNDSTQWYRLELYRATAHQRNGDTIWAKRIYNNVKTWSVTHNAHQLEGLVYNHLGTSALLAGHNRKACQYYERAYTLLNQPPKTNDLIAATINVADMYQQMGRLPLAAERYRYALYVADSLHDATNRASICCGLGQVYMELENFKEAHHFFDLASQNIENEALQTQHFYYFSLGNCYYLENKLDEALKSFEQAYKIAHQLDNSFIIHICEINMGEIYLMQNKLPEAQQQLQHVKLFLQQNGSQLTPESIFYIKSLLADLDIAQHKGCQVNDFLTQLNGPHPIRSPRYLMLHYRRLMRYAAQYGQWQRAFTYQTLSDQYADSLRSRQTRNNVAELASRYQRDTTLLRQQITLSDYSAKTARQQNIILIVVIVAVVLALTATLIIVVYRRYTQNRMKQQMERITELRMDIVRNRVSPHYIFNVLGTVLPKLQRDPELVEPVELLIDVLRGNLLTSGKVAVKLCDELALVQRFVSLHHYSKGEWPTVTWTIDPELANSEWLIPSMSLQIPVENALKHAFPALSAECAIHINITVLPTNELCLQVTDNGQGYNPGRIKRTNRDTGTGLRLLTRTLEILNQYNRHPASLTITNIPQPHHGTRIELRIPHGYNFTVQHGTRP